MWAYVVVPVVLLALVIGALMRALKPWRDEDLPGPADQRSPDGAQTGTARRAGELQIVLPIEDEPGEEYADELQQIRGELMAAEPRYDSLALITRIPRWMLDHGYTGEDWLRLNLPDGDYWAIREAEMASWRDGNDEDEKRYLRGCVRKGWLTMEGLAA